MRSYLASLLMLAACGAKTDSPPSSPPVAEPAKPAEPLVEQASTQVEPDEWADTCEAFSRHLSAHPRIQAIGYGRSPERDRKACMRAKDEDEHAREAYRCRLRATDTKSFEACETQHLWKSRDYEVRSLLALFTDATYALISDEAGGYGGPCTGTVAGPLVRSAIIPPLETPCHQGPEGHCVPSDSPSGPGEYDASLWTSDPIFSRMWRTPDHPTFFHYWVELGDCQIRVVAQGDADGDGVMSTYQRVLKIEDGGVVLGKVTSENAGE